MGQILVLNGPNQIGQPGHDPHYYGTVPLSEINRQLEKHVLEKGHLAEFYESHNENELAERVQLENNDGTGVIIINPTG